jgi:hypothetical protein
MTAEGKREEEKNRNGQSQREEEADEKALQQQRRRHRQQEGPESRVLFWLGNVGSRRVFVSAVGIHA